MSLLYETNTNICMYVYTNNIYIYTLKMAIKDLFGKSFTHPHMRRGADKLKFYSHKSLTSF